jgi:Fic family protein
LVRYVTRLWEPADRSLGIPRQFRRSCEYQAYVPDPLAVQRGVLLSDDAAADLAEAEQAIARLNEVTPSTANMEAVARLLLRAEAVASSRIEQLEVGERRLLLAEAARVMGEPTGDVTAEAVLGNIEAMRYAVEELAGKERITVEDMCEAHRRLLERTRHVHWGGVLRTEQNWIGGNGYNPCGADYVPPPPEDVPALMEDLADYMSSERHTPLVQAAIAHAQFESIHPFVDGNGRVGRALIHVVLKRRGLAPRYVPPISLILATNSRDYIAGLTASRYVGKPTDLEAGIGVALWVQVFAAAAARASRDAELFSAQIDELVRHWRRQAAPVRARSTLDLLLSALPSAPIITVATAAKLVGRSVQATNLAVDRLVRAGVLIPLRQARWGRVFEAAGLIDALTGFERAVASPAGDTRLAPPVRRVPAARRQSPSR